LTFIPRDGLNLLYKLICGLEVCYDDDDFAAQSSDETDRQTDVHVYQRYNGMYGE